MKIQVEDEISTIYVDDVGIPTIVDEPEDSFYTVEIEEVVTLYFNREGVLLGGGSYGEYNGEMNLSFPLKYRVGKVKRTDTSITFPHYVSVSSIGVCVHQYEGFLQKDGTCVVNTGDYKWAEGDYIRKYL